MSQPIIDVRGVSKRYRLGAIGATSLREEFQRAVQRFRGASARDEKDFWALRDVSFTVERGEVVGIIGRNGAGKSTLLKILSRITEPTTGMAQLRGRVASLLEVGTGFHPELTGRENIYLNGAILGMTRAEITGKLDEIVAFAEVEQFLDTPVKRYSSGMYVRLAFAVAAHLEPEILVVDEVLAVGDAAFQKKCLGKLRDVTSHGRTVLFVSHDMSAISALTQRCILLDKGQVSYAGPTSETVNRYFQIAAQQPAVYRAAADKTGPHIDQVEVRTSERAGIQAAGSRMDVVVTIKHAEPIAGACLSFQIINQTLQPATHVWIFDSNTAFAREPGATTLTCTFPKVRLNVGRYHLRLYLSEPRGGRMLDAPDGVCGFEVVRLGETTQWGWRPELCVYHEDCSWHVHAEQTPHPSSQ